MEPTAEEPKKKYVFSETPLPLDKLEGANIKLHVIATEVALEAGLLKDVDSTLTVDGGQLVLEWHAQGAFEGSLSGTAKLVPAGDGAADLSVEASIESVRAGFAAAEGVHPSEVPPTSVEMKLQARGASPRQMAAGANGNVLVTMGPGKVKSGLVGMFGSGILSQLASKLNPFAAQDPYTKLDCTVTRVDIVDWPDEGRARADAVREGHGHRGWQGRPRHGGARVRLQHPPARRHRDKRRHVHQPVHQGRRHPDEPADGGGGQGRRGRRRRGGDRRLVGGRKGLVDRIAGEVDVCKSTLEEATRHPTPAKTP